MVELIHGLTRSELGEAIAGFGEPCYRADQIWNWLYVKRAMDWSRLANIPAALREKLEENYAIRPVTLMAADGERDETEKLLLRLRDDHAVEEVLIPARHGVDGQGRRFTACLSSQVGCRFGCTFCASGLNGLERNLAAGEIVAQLLLGILRAGDDPVTHVVFMGVGEPFDNYDAVLKAVRIINNGEGLAIGARRITISTSGVVPGIERLAGEGLQVELSVSLHAAEDSLRSQLMPVNRQYPLPQLLAACRRYVAATHRIITFEYALVDGVNDSARQASLLVDQLCDIPCRINLIPLSPIAESGAKPSAPDATRHFLSRLGRAGVNATVRDSRGSSIRAACGQLRARYAGEDR